MLRLCTARVDARVGTLDDPDSFLPDIHIFTESKQPWVVIPGDVPVVDQYYRASGIWSQESLERRAAIKRKVN